MDQPMDLMSSAEQARSGEAELRDRVHQLKHTWLRICVTNFCVKEHHLHCLQKKDDNQGAFQKASMTLG